MSIDWFPLYICIHHNRKNVDKKKHTWLLLIFQLCLQTLCMCLMKPCVQYARCVHAHNYACACVWVWCLSESSSYPYQVFRGSWDKDSLQRGVTELLQTDSSSQHPASLHLLVLSVRLHPPSPAHNSTLPLLLYLSQLPHLSPLPSFSALFLLFCLSPLSSTLLFISASNFVPHTVHTGIHCGLTLASTMQARQQDLFICLNCCFAIVVVYAKLQSQCSAAWKFFPFCPVLQFIIHCHLQISTLSPTMTDGVLQVGTIPKEGLAWICHMKKKDLLVGRPYPGSPFRAQKSLPTETAAAASEPKEWWNWSGRERGSSKSIASSRQDRGCEAWRLQQCQEEMIGRSKTSLKRLI